MWERLPEPQIAPLSPVSGVTRQPGFRQTLAQHIRQVGNLLRHERLSSPENVKESERPVSPGCGRRRMAREPQDEHSSDETSPFHTPAVQVSKSENCPDQPQHTQEYQTTTQCMQAVDSLTMAGLLSAAGNLDRLSEASRTLPQSPEDLDSPNKVTSTTTLDVSAASIQESRVSRGSSPLPATSSGDPTQNNEGHVRAAQPLRSTCDEEYQGSLWTGDHFGSTRLERPKR